MSHGDGIGPEIMAATLRILDAAGARIAPRPIEIGERVYLAGHTSGITDEAWDVLRRTRVMLKAPVTTPSGGGYKSLNVTLRKALGLYANVRSCTSYAPFVATRHPAMDVVIVRENEEDLYAGIEHRQTDEVFQCLKLITRPGCERIVRYAFEYARSHGRRKVTCMVKDNIMKMTDGLFYDVFRELGASYPEIEQDRCIIDIGAARLATQPERFDVIVTPNLYGDILSDVAAELAGSANPSGLLLSAVMMLVHVRQPRVATLVHNAWLRTLEEGIHTTDVRGSHTRRVAGTEEFASAVIERLGDAPRQLEPVEYGETQAKARPAPARPVRRPAAAKAMVGVDVFVHDAGSPPAALGERLASLGTEALGLQLVTNRGVKVWPRGFPETFCTDHWRCRFVARRRGAAISHGDIVALLSKVTSAGVDVIKTENLCTFDGVPGFALAQGQ